MGIFYYVLYDVFIGVLIRELVVVFMEGEEKEYIFIFLGVFDGDYKLVVWGNLIMDYFVGILY